MGFADDDFAPPKKSDAYLKFKPGTHRIRMLSQPIVGNLGWTAKTGGKPIRKPLGAPWSPNEVHDPNAIKKFWAVAVWDYAAKMVKVWEVTQSTIMGQVRTLAKDADWGEPQNYDIAVTRIGSTMDDTEYTLTPKPKAALHPDVEDAWAACLASGFDLSRLFAGGDPFSADGKPRVQNDDDFNAAADGPDSDIPF